MGSRMYFHVLLALSLSALVSCQLQDQDQIQQQDVDENFREDFRLPTDLYPVQQWVELFTSLQEDDFSFWGTSTIKFEVLVETNQIVLHSCELTIIEEEVGVTKIDGDALQWISDLTIEYNTKFQFLIIRLNNDTLFAGSIYSVTIPFKASLQDATYGYVRTCYEDDSGNKNYYSASYFSAGMARRAFPVFDEPAFKTKFTISLGHQEGLIAISNMPIANSFSVQDKPGWVLDVFVETPEMPGYLVAIMVCQFEFITFEISGVSIKIWARSESMNQLRIAQETISVVLPYYNDVFGTQYSLPKLDIIAVPNYDSKNQESWGCIMMDEVNILYKEEKHLIYDATTVVANVCRLLAYQWFGSLVTMTWWTEINLPWGMAYLFSERALALYFDDWIYQDIRLAKIHRSEMNDDAVLLLSSALVAPIENADPMCLLQNLNRPKAYLMYRMCNMIVGQEAFLTGLKSFLKNFQYSIAGFTEFFNELNYAGTEAQTIPPEFTLPTFMDSWIYKKGYPMVKVDINFDNQMASLSQVRFISETRLSTDDRASLEKDCWPIPINWLTSANLNYEDYLAKDYLTCDSYLEIKLENFTTDMFLLLNIRALGIYRVLYPDQIWQRIIDVLLDVNTFETIDGVIRMQLISDSLEIAWPGYLPYSTPFKLLQYLVHETLEHPLRSALLSLRDIRERLKRTDMREKFHAYVRSFLQPIFQRWSDITLVPTNLFEARFKLMTDTWSGTYGVQDVLDQSLNILLQWYSSNNPDNDNLLDINVRETIYCYGIQQANNELWNFMYQRFLKGSDDDEKATILFSLGCTANTDLMKQYLGWALDSTYIDPKWSLTVILSIIYNEQATSFEIIFEFFMNNYQNICKILNDDMALFCPLISLIGNMIETQDELDQYLAFLNDAKLSDCKFDIDYAIQCGQNNIVWHNLHNEEWNNLLSSAQTETQTTDN